ncbi:hypothetical protein LCGC14_2297260, partial [marine sediment metagenome]
FPIGTAKVWVAGGNVGKMHPVPCAEVQFAQVRIVGQAVAGWQGQSISSMHRADQIRGDQKRVIRQV